MHEGIVGGEIRKATKSYVGLPNLFLIILWIMNGGSVFSVLNRILLLVMLFAFVVALLLYYRPKMQKKILQGAVLSLLIVICTVGAVYVFSIKPQDPDKYVYIIIEFIFQGVFCIYIFSVFTYSQFLLLFIKALKFIRWHALASAFLVSFFGFLFTTKVFNQVSGFEARTFLNLFYINTDQYSFSLFGLTLTRNQGLFWEPGVLQFYLNLLLLFQLYIIKVKKWPIILTVIAIISTYSTTAYLLMVIVLAGYLIQTIKRKPVYLIPIIIVAFGIFYPLVRSNVENKFQGEKQTSSMVRIYDFVQQLFVIKANVLTGVGLDDQRYQVVRAKYGMSQYYQSILGYNRLERGSSNSILFILAAMGLPLGGFWIYAYIKQGFIQHKKGLLTFLLILGVMVEPLLLKPFFVTFVMSGFMIIFIGKKKLAGRSLWRSEDVPYVPDPVSPAYTHLNNGQELLLLNR